MKKIMFGLLMIFSVVFLISCSKFENICEYIGHYYIEEVINPTCDEKGYTKFVCKDCKHSYVDLYKEPLGHEIIDIDEVSPTCTENGNTKGKKCSRCEKMNDFEVIPTKGHEILIDEAVEPTCTTTGLTEGKHCSRCDYKEQQVEIPRIDHSYQDAECEYCHEEEPYEVLNVQYDDYIDISSNDINFVDDNNSVACKTDNYLVATNIGATKVYIDNKLYLIEVSKAKINIITIMGQSNAGNHFVNSTSDITSPIGTAYWWGNGNGINAVEPVHYTQPSMRFHAPLLAELYAQSANDGNPIKNVMIWQEGITSKNGKSITAWASSESNTSGTNATATMIRNCVNYYSNNSNKYEIVGNGIYWLQGESDINMEPTKYIRLFMAMWSNLKDAGAEYVAFFRVRKAITDNYVGSKHMDLDYHGSLSAQLYMINNNPNMFLATTITENWIGDETDVHSVDISDYISMMNTYGAFSTFSDSYGNKATIKNGILTTTMKELYGSNNKCHYGKFGAAIIACDAAKNMYKALYSNDFEFVLADTSGNVDNQLTFKSNEKVTLNIDDFENNIAFRASCGSVSGELKIKVYSGDLEITDRVISNELNTYGTVDINYLRVFNDIKIVVTYSTIKALDGILELSILNDYSG